MEAIRVQHTIQKSSEITTLTARQLRQSALIGLWQEREEIEDSALYARQLRAQAQTRPAIDALTDTYQ